MRLHRGQWQSVLFLVSTTSLCEAALSHNVNTKPQARSQPPRHSSCQSRPCEHDKTSRCKKHHSVMTRRLTLDQSFLVTFLGLLFPTGTTSDPAIALTPEQAATQYDAYAPTYDRLDGGQASTTLGIEEARAALLRRAVGKVLEVGVGTGLNLDKYIGSQISSLTLVDISDGMLQATTERVKTLLNLQGIPVKVVRADATSELVDRFGTEAFDTVVDSFSLCVMGNQGAKDCMDQISRVVKPGGKVLLLENARSSNPLLGVYQDATADAAALAGGKGCVYNQDVAAMIRATGRLAIREETSYLTGLFRGYVCSRSN